MTKRVIDANTFVFYFIVEHFGAVAAAERPTRPSWPGDRCSQVMSASLRVR